MAPRRLSNHLWIASMIEEALDSDNEFLFIAASDRNDDKPRTTEGTSASGEGDVDFESLAQQEWASDYIWIDEPKDTVSGATVSGVNKDCTHECQTFSSASTSYPRTAAITTVISSATRVSVTQTTRRPLFRASYREVLESGLHLTFTKEIYRSDWRFCCHFARLPLEIRQQIYKFAMDEDLARPVLVMDGVLKGDGNRSKWYWEQDFLGTVLPSLCQASRTLLFEAGPVFLKNALFILDGNRSLRTLDYAIKSATITSNIPEAKTMIRELWFSAICSANKRDRWGSCFCSDCKTHPWSNLCPLLRDYTGLRNVVIHIEDWRFKSPTTRRGWEWYNYIHSTDKSLRRALHVDELIRLPNLSDVTLFCTLSGGSTPLDPLPALTLVSDWLVEGIREHDRVNEEEDTSYYIYDLQRLFEPEREDCLDLVSENSVRMSRRKDLVVRIKYQSTNPFKFWFEAEAGRKFQEVHPYPRYRESW